MQSPDIVVVGSSNTDMIVRLERIPGPGETVLGGEFLTAAGGKGANQAVAAARAGARVCFIGRMGCDALGDNAVAALQKNGILTHVVRDQRAASGVALIFVARSGENTIAVASGANARLLPADVKKVRGVLASAKILLMQLETPMDTVIAAARLAASRGAAVILNPAPAQSLSRALLRSVTILTPNESEAEMLTGIRMSGPGAAEKAARELRKRGAQNVIITLGARGALVATQQGIERIPGFRVKPLDTTAAGDVFNGALAVGLSEGRSLVQAVRFANAAAAVSVTRLGAQPSIPKRRDIERFLKRGIAVRRQPL